MEEQNVMEEPLESSYPISILRNNTIKLLSAKLNPPKILLSEGLTRNWKGLAELCSIESYLISNWEFSTDPTKELFKIWQAKGNQATIRQMVIFLQKLDRWDVIEDVTTHIAEDIAFHVQNPKDHKKQSPLYQDLDSSILTVDDVEYIEKNKQLIQYDAFVLFADDDIDFATEVIETMEKQYKLKFCVKDYLIGGLFEHEAIIRLISQRCEKLIVILTPSFFNSPMNKFFLNFTQAMSLEQRKIIPCLYKPCPMMPPEIRCYFMLDYTKPRVLWNFWDKLYESIKTKKAPANASNRVVRRDLPPRQLIIKNNSQRDTEFRLRAPPVNVKSNSLVDLTKTDADHILPEVNLIPSTSANSLGISFLEPEKVKVKRKSYNWLKKLFPKHGKELENCGQQHIKVNGEMGGGREKKKLFSKYVKRKPVAAT